MKKKIQILYLYSHGGLVFLKTLAALDIHVVQPVQIVKNCTAIIKSRCDKRMGKHLCNRVGKARMESVNKSGQKER